MSGDSLIRIRNEYPESMEFTNAQRQIITLTKEGSIMLDSIIFAKIIPR
jgi:hypothetical protein